MDCVLSQVERITAGWRGALPVTVVPTAADLPYVRGLDVRGVFDGADVWIVADVHQNESVPNTLAHEMIGHHGLRLALGSAWSDFMSAVQGGVRAGDLHLGDIRSEVRRVYGPLPACVESDEVCAGILERSINQNTGRFEPDYALYKRALAAFGHFKREGLYAVGPASYDEIEGTLLVAQHHVRFGGCFFGLGRIVRGWYAATMTKPWNPNRPPISLADSESMLQAERSREFSRSAFTGLFGAILLIGSLGVLIYGLLSWLF